MATIENQLSLIAGIKHSYDINTKFVHSLRDTRGNPYHTPRGIANPSQISINSNSQFFWLRLGKAPVIGGVQSAIYGEHPNDGMRLKKFIDMIFNK
ncbi:MAG: hypothetical protein LBH32_04190 [Dysgonamonadaceae bacterium]|jgi:hypothetical protein|nr:hypothetical protein [Dysgonamonadaceae bacterium]